MLRALVASVLVMTSITGCKRSVGETAVAELTMATRALEPSEPRRVPEPVHMVEVPVTGDLPFALVRGSTERQSQLLFLAGMCANPGGYMMSFQNAAAAHGDLVGVQGDISCGGDGTARSWSADLGAIDRRIDAAFDAAELGAPRDVIIIGYSQGAQRAEQLVARSPEKYSRAVLIGTPIKPTPQDLGHARAVVLMAGTYDAAFARMRGAVSTLERAAVPVAFLPIANARHGEMGDTPEQTMGEALDFVDPLPTTTPAETSR
jgi:predicted esterase